MDGVCFDFAYSEEVTPLPMIKSRRQPRAACIASLLSGRYSVRTASPHTHHPLRILAERVAFFACLSDLISYEHRIDEESPLFGMTPEDFQKQDIRVIASIVGVDTVIVAPVQSFADYNYDQIEWNRRFVEIYDENEEGQWTVDYGRIDETEDIAPIQNLAKDREEQAVGRNTTLSDSQVGV